MARKKKREFERKLREQGLSRKEAKQKRKIIDRTLYHADRKWGNSDKKSGK